MPEENPLIEIVRKVTREQEQKARVHREHLNRLKDIFRQKRNSLTDAELLEIILEAGTFLDRPEFNQEDDLDPYMNSLTFTMDSLVDDDGEGLKTAWSEFLDKTLVDMKTRTDDSYEVVALWYSNKEMWSHSVAVYEHIYHQVRSCELVNEQEFHAEWVLELWKSCVRRGLKQRTRELFGRIAEYHDDGEISFEDYCEVSSKDSELRYSEIRETIDRDRNLSRERLTLEFGATFGNLHPLTRNLVIDAELWSDVRMQKIEPSTGPLRWALAIESEFHHKIYNPNQEVLGNLLGELRPKHGKTCGVGQINKLIEVSGSNPIKKAFVEKKISNWRNLVSVPDLVRNLKEISKDRNRIAHVDPEGSYTKENSVEFVEHFRNSGWIFRFFSSLTVTG